MRTGDPCYKSHPKTTFWLCVKKVKHQWYGHTKSYWNPNNSPKYQKLYALSSAQQVLLIKGFSGEKKWNSSRKNNDIVYGRCHPTGIQSRKCKKKNQRPIRKHLIYQLQKKYYPEEIFVAPKSPKISFFSKKWHICPEFALKGG